ncbi:unnamed protein product [Sphagnum balticum]
MGRGSRYQHCSKKYPVPRFSGAWSGSGGENEESEGTTTGGEGVVILAGGGGNGRTGVPNCLLLAQYDFSSSALSDAFHNFSTDDDPPYRLAVQPGGKGFVRSFENDCRLFTLKKAVDNDGETRIFSDERQIEVLQAVGEQNSLVFSADGTRLAAGGDDGHLRVFEWPSFKRSQPALRGPLEKQTISGPGLENDHKGAVVRMPTDQQWQSGMMPFLDWFCRLQPTLRLHLKEWTILVPALSD